MKSMSVFVDLEVAHAIVWMRHNAVRQVCVGNGEHHSSYHAVSRAGPKWPRKRGWRRARGTRAFTAFVLCGTIYFRHLMPPPGEDQNSQARIVPVAQQCLIFGSGIFAAV
jgi:hypothetical protein